MKGAQSDAKKRVFILDDHPLVREWLANLINQRFDLTICGEADNLQEALSGIAASHPDVAIVDLVLHGTFHVEVIKEIKKLYPEIVVVVLSMHEEALYAERALRNGAAGFVSKREATKEIIAAIYRVLDGKTYFSESLAGAIASGVLNDLRNETKSIRRLSDRELRIFQMIGKGLKTSEIARDLQISAKTVQSHCARMQKKLELDGFRELLRQAVLLNRTDSDS